MHPALHGDACLDGVKGLGHGVLPRYRNQGQGGLAALDSGAQGTRCGGRTEASRACSRAGAKLGQGQLDRGFPGGQPFDAGRAQRDDEVVGRRPFGDGEAHGGEHLDVEFGRHGHLRRQDARRVGDRARYLHQAHRVVVGTRAQVHGGDIVHVNSPSDRASRAVQSPKGTQDAGNEVAPG